MMTIHPGWSGWSSLYLPPTLAWRELCFLVKCGDRAEVDVQELEASFVLRETLAEAGEVALVLGRPDNFGECDEAREGHVLDVLRVGNVLGPELALRAQDVMRLLQR